MYLVAIGAAKLKYWWDYPRFAVISVLSLRQAKRSAGALRAEVFPHDGHYFSLTVWKSGADMKRFATSGAHRHALQMQPRLTETSRFHCYKSVHMPTQAEALAAWQAMMLQRVA